MQRKTSFCVEKWYRETAGAKLHRRGPAGAATILVRLRAADVIQRSVSAQNMEAWGDTGQKDPGPQPAFGRSLIPSIGQSKKN